MSRPLRRQFPGALYHVTARGNRQADIYLDERDRLAWLDVVGEVSARYNFIIHSFCQMTNHYHLLLETIDGNLSKGLRQLNGEYARHFNHRHDQLGHVFQGRFYSEVCTEQSHVLEVSRYIVLNPVRAGMTEGPGEWNWSSYAALTGVAAPPPWLDVAWLLGQFGSDTGAAIRAYTEFVAQGIGRPYPLQNPSDPDSSGQADGAHSAPERMKEYPRLQRRSCSLSLPEYASQYQHRNEAMARAFLSTAYSMREIAEHFRVSYKTVSRAVQQFEDKNE